MIIEFIKNYTVNLNFIEFTICGVFSVMVTLIFFVIPSRGALSCHLHGVARPPSNEQVAKSTSPPTGGEQSIVITWVSAISRHSSMGVSGPEINC